MHLAAFSVGSLGESGIVGSLMPAAVGAALSARLRGTDQVCLCFFGDGAANCGPFHESLNLAAIWKLPVIFLCENNGYAMCSAQAKTTAVTDIASRAVSYGIPGSVVDGQTCWQSTKLCRPLYRKRGPEKAQHWSRRRLTATAITRN
jgi:TPP-dependent pyruvate/acetoin dehydrogenase alpha subunit